MSAPSWRPYTRLWMRCEFYQNYERNEKREDRGKGFKRYYCHTTVVQVVKLAECEIYSYNPEADADPFLERGAM